DVTLTLEGAQLFGTSTESAAGGIATFADLSVRRAGTGYTLAASAESFTGDRSDTFSIRADGANQLVFAADPPDGIAGVALSPSTVVHILDQFGNLAVGSSAAVSVALTATGPALLGTLAVNASAGVATFSDLSLAQTGTGYTLSA